MAPARQVAAWSRRFSVRQPMWPRTCPIVLDVFRQPSYRSIASKQSITSARFHGGSGTRSKRVLQTLDPARLSRSDHVDFSNVTGALIHFHPVGSARSSILGFIETGSRRLRFPPDTKGFLYFVPAPHPSVQLASEVRFRITRDDDPSSFHGGDDLLYPDSTPWKIPLVALARHSKYSVLKHLLSQDGLIATPLLNLCTGLKKSILPSGRVIHSLGQIFSLDFQETQSSFHFASADSMRWIQFEFLSERRGKYQSKSRSKNKSKKGQINPYVGSALCCFEKSILPSHEGTRTLVIRVKKITSPAKTLIPGYDGRLPKPEEGQLVMRLTNGRKIEPWSVNVDKKGMGADLDGLFRDVI